MSNAKLLAIGVERFKSFDARTRVELAPVTVVLGRNNSGKSSLIQSLLLLKQSLADPRQEVRFNHEGVLVDAFSLRELTFGWPVAAEWVEGPTLEVEWESDVAPRAAFDPFRPPDFATIARLAGVPWFANPPDSRTLRTRMTLETVEIDGAASLSSLTLESVQDRTTLTIAIEGGTTSCLWNGSPGAMLEVEFEHFIPYLRVDWSNLGPRDRQRAWYNAYLVLFAEPLSDLKKLLSDLQYLGSGRESPPSLYRAKAAPSELGASGELAAHLLHRRSSEIVHFLPLPEVSRLPPVIPATVHARPLVDAVNEMMAALSVHTPVRVEDVKDVGFRLMFGEASIVHVGRGLGSLLPLVELGLFADPLRFTGDAADIERSKYAQQCGAYTLVALEEPEAHLHPKVASRLAHWLVSLALSNRRLIVETHSDHLVRRLRGLVARAGKGTELERWLLDNVVVLSVEQDADGRSTVTSSRLTADGGVGEVWPADFMDEATDEESAIYYAKLDKTEDGPSAGGVHWNDGDEPELDDEP